MMIEDGTGADDCIGYIKVLFNKIWSWFKKTIIDLFKKEEDNNFKGEDFYPGDDYND